MDIKNRENLQRSKTRGDKVRLTLLLGDPRKVLINDKKK